MEEVEGTRGGALRCFYFRYGSAALVTSPSFGTRWLWLVVVTLSEKERILHLRVQFGGARGAWKERELKQVW